MQFKIKGDLHEHAFREINTTHIDFLPWKCIHLGAHVRAFVSILMRGEKHILQGGKRVGVVLCVCSIPECFLFQNASSYMTTSLAPPRAPLLLDVIKVFSEFLPFQTCVVQL